MRILFVNQYYWPDCAATAQMLSDLAEHLVRHGHEVHVLCSRGRYAGSAAVTPPRREVRNGVHIRRVAAWPSVRRGWGRLAQDLAFHLATAMHVLMQARRYDVIVSLTTPPLIGWHAAMARRFNPSLRHVLWSMDLYPDIAFAMQVLRQRGLVASLLRRASNVILHRADACVALGDCMAQRLRELGVNPDALHTIPVWSSNDLAPPVDDALRHEHDLLGKFIVMYSGNAGMLHTFDAVCAAALQLRDDDRFVFVFSGGGRRLREIEAFRDQHQLANIRVLPYAPREQLPQWLAMGDLHLVTLRDGMQGLAVPCKLYGIMAAARPVLYLGPPDSDTAIAVRDANCGILLPTDDAAALVAALHSLLDNRELRVALGARARAAFMQHYNARRCVEQWRLLLDSLAPVKRSAPRADAVHTPAR